MIRVQGRSTVGKSVLEDDDGGAAQGAESTEEGSALKGDRARRHRWPHRTSRHRGRKRDQVEEKEREREGESGVRKLGQRIKKRRRRGGGVGGGGGGTERPSSWPEITNKTFTLRRAANRPGRTRCVSV